MGGRKHRQSHKGTPENGAMPKKRRSGTPASRGNGIASTSTPAPLAANGTANHEVSAVAVDNPTLATLHLPLRRILARPRRWTSRPGRRPLRQLSTMTSRWPRTMRIAQRRRHQPLLPELGPRHWPRHRQVPVSETCWRVALKFGFEPCQGRASTSRRPSEVGMMFSSWLGVDQMGWDVASVIADLSTRHVTTHCMHHMA